MRGLKVLYYSAIVLCILPVCAGKDINFEILEHKVILTQYAEEIDPSSLDVNNLGHTSGGKIRRVQRYTAWPGITQAKNGDIIVAFSGDRDTHVCPWGKLQIIRSEDEGRTWSDPVTIACTPLDDRDAGIMTTDKGTIIVNWFTSVYFMKSPRLRKYYERHADKVTKDVQDKWLGYWLMRSEDNGYTWNEPIKMPCSSPSNPARTSSGSLIFMGKDFRVDPFLTLPIHSRDDGKSWEVLAADPFDEPFDIKSTEPHIVQIKGDRLLAVFRQHGKPVDRSDDFIFQSFSEDGGRSWSTPEQTPMLGYPPHLLKLNNGWVLCSYGRRIPPYGQRACISTDGGKTWEIESEITLRDDAPNPDLGYPASIQLKDDSILTVYYQVNKGDKKPSLMTTRWKLK